MIDCIPQRFEIGMLIDHRGAQIRQTAIVVVVLLVPDRLAQHHAQRARGLVGPRCRSGKWYFANQISGDGIQAHSG